MDKEKLLCMMQSIADGKLSPGSAVEQLKNLPYADMGFAHVDSHRSLRQGYAEVIFSPGKTAEQIFAIALKLRETNPLVIASRTELSVAEAVLNLVALDSEHSTSSTNCDANYSNESNESHESKFEVSYEPKAKALVFGKLPDTVYGAAVVNVVTAGTGDIAVAEEAALFLQAAGIPVQKLYDVGVAGIHRLLDKIGLLRQGAITIVCAGMDGALPSVIGGILDGPVIAVPTSIGYGAAFEGLAPLLTMLNSCAAGITVVNIDNGFGAAYAALRMHNMLRHDSNSQNPKTQNTGKNFLSLQT